MNGKGMTVDDLIILNISKELKDSIADSLDKHITGVFIALAQISVQHFMLSYLLLDLCGI